MSLGQIELFGTNKRKKEIALEIALLEAKKKLLTDEIEKLEIIRNRNLNNEKLVDTTDLYVIKKNGVTYITKKSNRFDGLYKDIFNESNTFSYIENLSPYRFDLNSIKPIREEFEEINAYPDGQVPEKLLELLYYKANNIDSKMLKMAYSEKTSN